MKNKPEKIYLRIENAKDENCNSDDFNDLYRDLIFWSDKKLYDSDIEFRRVNKKRGNTKFEPPTMEEFIEFFVENDYKKEAARMAYRHYVKLNWCDVKGRKIKNWKLKVKKVWFRPVNKDPNAFLKRL